MLRRLVNIFKRGETAIKTPQIEKKEFLFQQGSSKVKIEVEGTQFENIQTIVIETNTTTLKVENPFVDMKTASLETSTTKENANEKVSSLLNNAKTFNNITTATSKVIAGTTVAGTLIINNSKREDGEIQRIANSKAEDAFEDIF